MKWIEKPMSRPEQLLDQYFPEEVLLPLAEKYDFAPANPAIRHFLGRAVSSFTRHAETPKNMEQRRTQKKELEKALRHFERMERALMATDVWDGFVPLQNLPLIFRLPRLSPAHPKHLEYLKLEREFLEKGLPMFRKWLSLKIAETSGEAGRPRNVGLQRFTEYMELIWSDELGRHFTVDYHKGSGTTLAFEFVRDMISPVASPTDSEIISAMRFVISEFGAHKN